MWSHKAAFDVIYRVFFKNNFALFAKKLKGNCFYLLGIKIQGTLPSKLTYLHDYDVNCDKLNQIVCLLLW